MLMHGTDIEIEIVIMNGVDTGIGIGADIRVDL